MCRCVCGGAYTLKHLVNFELTGLHFEFEMYCFVSVRETYYIKSTVKLSQDFLGSTKLWN
jgi:hypothetical protein